MLAVMHCRTCHVWPAFTAIWRIPEIKPVLLPSEIPHTLDIFIVSVSHGFLFNTWLILCDLSIYRMPYPESLFCGPMYRENGWAFISNLEIKQFNSVPSDYTITWHNSIITEVNCLTSEVTCRRRKPLALKLLLDQGRWNDILIRASKYAIKQSQEEPTSHNKRETKYVFRYILIRTKISVCKTDLL